jgi:ubiquinone biosynthesis protein
MKVMQRYKIYFKEENYLLAKSIVTMEGVGKKLYPQFNAAVEIKPFIIKLYKKHFSPLNILKQSHEINKEILNFILNAPADINDIISKIKNGKLKIEFEHVGLEEFQEKISSSFNRLSTAIIIAALLIGSAMLLASHIPPVIGDVSLFGIIGFLFATILGILLIFTVLRGR